MKLVPPPFKRLALSLAVVCAAGLLLIGCASLDPNERSPLARHPDAYRRLTVMPIWFDGRAYADASLTTNDLVAINHTAGTNTAKALERVLTDKGYEVAEAPRVVCETADLNAFEPDTRGLLSEARTNFMSLSRQIIANRPNEKGKWCVYKMEGDISELRRRLGIPEADALVLLEFDAFFESPEARHKRNTWNWTGGVVLSPFTIAGGLVTGRVGGQGPIVPIREAPSWVRIVVVVLDARTQEALFWQGRGFGGQDARNPDVLRDRLREVLADLPQVPKQK